MKTRAVSRSERGLVRPENQDSVLCLDGKSVFLVADGMGGGAEGALASQIVCEELRRGIAADDYALRLDEIGKSVDAANARIFAYATERRFRQMGTTVAVLALDDASKTPRGAIGYAGDSRVYRVRGGAAELLTRDHSVGSELETCVGGRQGHAFARRSNPLAHVLTRAVGTAASVRMEWRKVDVAHGDRFLICTDGVHDVVETEDLAPLVAAGGLEEAADRLAARVVSRGAPDNYSFVLLDVGGPS